MKSLHWILLSASIASAEMVPVLSEPMVVSDSGLTLTARGWGDTAIWARRGRIGYYVRHPDSIQLIADLRSDSIDAIYPRVLQGTITGAFVLGRNAILDVGLSGKKEVVSMEKFELSMTPIQASQYLEFKPDTLFTGHILGCGGHQFYDWKTDQYYRWRLADSFRTDREGVLCATDNVSGFGIWMWPVEGGRYAFRSGPASGLGRSASTDTLSALSLHWVVVDSMGSWLASDGKGRFYRSTTSEGSKGIDSTYVPELDHGISSDVTGWNAARRDSFVVFGSDSMIVLAKWTSSGFGILSTVSLPYSWVTEVAMGPSYLWVNTIWKLYSFRWTWRESELTNVRVSRLVTKIGIRSDRKGVAFTGSGAAQERVDLVEWNGRRVGSLELGSGRSVTWMPPHPGIYFARSANGIQRFLAR